MYLDERGINSGLALFLPDLAEYKEQKWVHYSFIILYLYVAFWNADTFVLFSEYLSWLKQVKGFLEAWVSSQRSIWDRREAERLVVGTWSS